MTVDFDRLLAGVTDSFFRLETLQNYTVDEYDERLHIFREEGRLAATPPRKVEWCAWIEERTAAGQRVHRVHVLDLPANDYIRYELRAYEENVAAGEDVRLADRCADPALDRLRTDFILLDGDTDHPVVLLQQHSPEGELIGMEESRDPADVERCRRDRDLAIAHSIPLGDVSAAFLDGSG
jgi:hypothetical protein